MASARRPRRPGSTGQGPFSWDRLGLLALLLCALVGGLSPRRALGDGGEFYGRSALHTGAHGSAALYRLVQERGIEVTLWDEPFWGPPWGGRGLVVLLAPTVPLEVEELEAILAHVREGGRLILVMDSAEARRRDAWAMSWPKHLTSLVNALGLYPQSQGVASTSLEGSLIPLKTIPGSALPQGGRVRQRGGLGFRWRGAAEPDAHVLLEDDAGIRAVALPYGEGVAVVVADMAPFSNRWLAEDANAAFAVGLIESLRGETPVIWDGFHHGVQLRSGGLKAFLASPMAVAGIHGILVASLGLLWFGRREASARPEPPLPPGRDVRLQVEELADLYGRSGGAAMAVEPVIRDGARRLGASLGLPAGTASEEVIAQACEAVGQGRDDLAALIRKAREDGGDGAAIALSRRLDKLLGRLEDVPR